MTSPQGAFGDYQLEIYGAGLQGVLPRFPMAFAELEARAEQALPPSVLSYVAGGAGSELVGEALVLLDWIVELGESIGELSTRGVGLEALDQIGITLVSSRQR